MTRLSGALAGNAVPLAVAAAAFALAVGLPAGDPDMWWHLASGRWMVEHRELLGVDVFSSTATGEPYALGEPFGQAILWLAYASGSWLGVAVLRAGLVAVAAVAATRLALRAAPPAVAVPLAAAALLLSKPTWTDRPQLWTLALFPVVLDLCFAARAGSRAALVAATAIVVLWGELHAGYALGIAVLGIFAVEAMLTGRRPAGFAVAAVVALAMVGVEPGALSSIRAVAHVGGSTVRIVEESPVEILTPFGALFALFVGGTIALLMRSSRSGRTLAAGGRGDDRVLAALVIVPVLWLALSAQRHIPLFGIAVLPFIAGPLAELVSGLGQGLEAGGTTLRRGGVGALWSSRVPPLSSSDRRNLHRSDADLHGSGATAHLPSRDTPRASVGDRGTDASHFSSELSLPSESSLRASGAPSSRSFPLPLAPGLAAALWLGAFVSAATADPAPDLTPYPVAAIPALESSRGILLNEYDWGGYLIWSVPDRPVFVDGRLYPFVTNGVMTDYERAVHVGPGWRGVLERWSVARALLRPDRALAQALRDDGWAEIARDATFVLLERPR